MITVERTIRARRGVDQVFAYLRDFTHTEQWDPGTVRTVRTDSGPLREGSTFRNVSEFRGRRTELAYELTTSEDGRRLLFTGRNKTVTSTDDMTFAASDDGGTVLTYRASLRFHGFARLAEPLLRRGFEKVADETEEKLSSTLAALTITNAEFG